MRRFWKKLVQGLSTAAVAVTGATLSISVLYGELLWFGDDAALRVGVPAFFAGLLFFPVDFRTLRSRAGFSLRAAAATAASCAAHRALLWAARADGWDPMQPIALDTTMWLAITATGVAAVTAWAAQPALMRLARGRLGTGVAAISSELPVRVPTRVRG